MRLLALLLLVVALISVPLAQTTPPQPVQSSISGFNADKLGAHQIGGRGCLGCHTLHTGDAMPSTRDAAALSWSPELVSPTDKDQLLWAEDIGPILELGTITTGGGNVVDFSTALTTQRRILTGVVFCLSCHDGDVARGAMMTNQSFQQAMGMLPANYGFYPIPTLLGDDGSASGNYRNDHPIGQRATVASLGADSLVRYLDLDFGSEATKLVLRSAQPDSSYLNFRASYGLPSIIGGRASGLAVDSGARWAGEAYVVCTTCHTPHSMFEVSASVTNPIAGMTSGTFTSYSFLAGPFNPGASTHDGRRASSATQFCRQCHFSDAEGSGGANEYAGISIPTGF